MTRRTIGIIDYGAGNLSSVQRAINGLGHRSRVTGDRDVLDAADLLILPGVGAFPAAMAGLAATGLDTYVLEQVRLGRPLVGICLGMQLLVDASSEHRQTAGLGLIPGQVGALQQSRWHIGWNNMEVVGDDPMFRPSDGQSFYFNHSYELSVPPEYCVGMARINHPVVAAIRRASVVGLQFHPEKSQGAGRQLLANVIEGLCA